RNREGAAQSLSTAELAGRQASLVEQQPEERLGRIAVPSLLFAVYLQFDHDVPRSFKLRPGLGGSGNIFPSRPTPSSGSCGIPPPGSASRKRRDFGRNLLLED